jgi:hypothetical protein
VAIKVNGATISWRAYEFGIKFASGQVTRVANHDEAVAAAEHYHAKPVFRAVYETDWFDTE